MDNQLYILPDKEAIKNPFESPRSFISDEPLLKGEFDGFNEGVNAVYSQAELIDINELAKYISNNYETRTKEEVCLYAWKLKTLISEYIK